MEDLASYFSKHGFQCNKRGTDLDCIRDDGLSFVVEIRDDKVILRPSGHEEDLEEIEDKESALIEFQGLVSDLKTILYKKDYRVQDEVTPFLEELDSSVE